MDRSVPANITSYFSNLIDWESLQFQQSTFFHHQKNSTPPKSSVPGTIPEEEESGKGKTMQPSLIPSQSFTVDLPSDIPYALQKKVVPSQGHEQVEEARKKEETEEAETEEDYPMLRLDYRLKYASSIDCSYTIFYYDF